MKQVVITGVSTGIGYACVKVLVDRGFRVYGSVRKPADAARLQQEFGEEFVPLLFDVTDEPAVQAGAEKVKAHLDMATLDGLVNNAGIEIAGPLAYLPTDQFRYQLEVNLTGPLIVTKAFLPLLGADQSRKGRPGRIVNISSAGGKIAGPFTGAYSASSNVTLAEAPDAPSGVQGARGDGQATISWTAPSDNNDAIKSPASPAGIFVARKCGNTWSGFATSAGKTSPESR